MIRTILTASLLMALTAPLAPAPAAAASAKTLRYLTPADIDPTRLLPPPPADGSDQNRAELADLHRIIGARTPADLAKAKWDDDHEDPSMYYATVGPNFDLKAFPATAELLAIVQDDASLAATAAKKVFARKRPWAVDATIPTCDPDDKPLTSYPSGHATLGYSLGMTLAALIPERAQAFMTRASDYAHSREVCGSHYASDTRASQALAAAFVTALLKDPEFQRKFDAAKAELRAAKFAN